MGDFFRGWRRKIGIVTLVMACLSATAWMACLWDHAAINRLISDIVPPQDGRFGLLTDEASITLGTFMAFQPGQFRAANVVPPKMSIVTAQGIRLYLLPIFDIPFWRIVTPLAMLSTYLLLSKPRTSHPKSVVDTVAVEGT